MRYRTGTGSNQGPVDDADLTPLGALDVPSAQVLEHGPAGSLVGFIQGRTAGTTLELLDNSDDRFALSPDGTNLITGPVGFDFFTNTFHIVALKERAPDGAERISYIHVFVIDEVDDIRLQSAMLRVGRETPAGCGAVPLDHPNTGLVTAVGAPIEWLLTKVSGTNKWPVTVTNGKCPVPLRAIDVADAGTKAVYSVTANGVLTGVTLTMSVQPVAELSSALTVGTENDLIAKIGYNRRLREQLGGKRIEFQRGSDDAWVGERMILRDFGIHTGVLTFTNSDPLKPPVFKARWDIRGSKNAVYDGLVFECYVPWAGTVNDGGHMINIQRGMMHFNADSYFVNNSSNDVRNCKFTGPAGAPGTWLCGVSSAGSVAYPGYNLTVTGNTFTNVFAAVRVGEITSVSVRLNTIRNFSGSALIAQGIFCSAIVFERNHISNPIANPATTRAQAFVEVDGLRATSSYDRIQTRKNIMEMGAGNVLAAALLCHDLDTRVGGSGTLLTNGRRLTGFTMSNAEIGNNVYDGGVSQAFVLCLGTWIVRNNTCVRGALPNVANGAGMADPGMVASTLTASAGGATYQPTGTSYGNLWHHQIGGAGLAANDNFAIGLTGIGDVHNEVARTAFLAPYLSAPGNADITIGLRPNDPGPLALGSGRYAGAYRPGGQWANASTVIITLGPTSLDNAIFPENAPYGTLIGHIIGATPGSFRYLRGTHADEGRVVFNPDQTQLWVGSTSSDYEGGPNPIFVTIEEEMDEAVNGPTYSTPQQINLSDVIEPFVTGLDVMNNLLDTADFDIPPAVHAGDQTELLMNGAVIRITMNEPVTIDATKVAVRLLRPGFERDGTPVWREDIVYGNGILRRASPNHMQNLPAGPNAFYVTLDEYIYQPDQIVSLEAYPGFYPFSTHISFPGTVVGRLDTLPYPKMGLRCVNQPWRRMDASGSLSFEFAAIYKHAAFGQQLARVEAWARVGGVTGPVGVATEMVRSELTPATGRLPSGLPMPVFKVDVSGTGLADGAGEILWRGYPWFGDSAWDSEAKGYDFPTTHPMKSLPFVRDYAGTHAPIYVWVNANGVAGASPSVRTDTVDPGSAGSYATMLAAATAGRAYNATRGHNDISGVHIMLRDIAASVMGDNNNAYAVRASMSALALGLTPMEIRAASGVTSEKCRLRGVLPDGSAPASKVIPARTRFRNITFDGSNAPNANANTCAQHAASASTPAAAIYHTLLVDCDLIESAGSGLFSNVFNSGWRYDLRVNQQGYGTNSFGGAGTATFHFLVASIGSRYVSDAGTGQLVPGLLGGVWAIGTSINHQGALAAATPNYTLPITKATLYTNVRCDHNNAVNAILALGGSHPITDGAFVSNVLIRKWGVMANFQGPAIRVSADGTRKIVEDLTIQYLSSDAGVLGNQDRVNILYNDQGYLAIPKGGSIRWSALGSYNTKRDTFDAPETPNASNDGAWSPGYLYYQGMLVHDNNPTLSLRRFYQAWKEHMSVAGDLSNPLLWLDAGAAYNSPFYQQPGRTGNWRFSHQIGSMGNTYSRTEGGGTTITPLSWYGERLGRGCRIEADWPNYFKQRTGGQLAGFTDWGDYRPKSIDEGDSDDSPLLNRVPPDMAAVPFDLYGRPRFNDGTGAAGALERGPL